MILRPLLDGYAVQGLQSLFALTGQELTVGVALYIIVAITLGLWGGYKR